MFLKKSPELWADDWILGNENFHQLARWAAVLLVLSHQRENLWSQALEDNEDTAAVTRFKDNVTETWIEAHFERWNHFEHGGPWILQINTFSLITVK